MITILQSKMQCRYDSHCDYFIWKISKCNSIKMVHFKWKTYSLPKVNMILTKAATFSVSIKFFLLFLCTETRRRTLYWTIDSCVHNLWSIHTYIILMIKVKFRNKANNFQVFNAATQFVSSADRIRLIFIVSPIMNHHGCDALSKYRDFAKNTVTFNFEVRIISDWTYCSGCFFSLWIHLSSIFILSTIYTFTE